MQVFHRVFILVLFLILSATPASAQEMVQAPSIPQAAPEEMLQAPLILQTEPLEPAIQLPPIPDAPPEAAMQLPLIPHETGSGGLTPAPSMPQAASAEAAAQQRPLSPEQASLEAAPQMPLALQEAPPETLAPPPLAPPPATAEAVTQNPPAPQTTPDRQTTPDPQYPKIVLFSTAWCPHCKTVKEYLARNNIPFINRDVDDDTEAFKLLTDKYKSQSVPLIVFGDDAEVMNGFTEERFQKALDKVKAGDSQ